MYCSQIIYLWMKLLHNHPFKLILTVTSKLLMTFCVRDKIQKNDLEFGSILKRLKLQMKLNANIVVRFTIIMQEKQVLHLCFII